MTDKSRGPERSQRQAEGEESSLPYNDVIRTTEASESGIYLGRRSIEGFYISYTTLADFYELREPFLYRIKKSNRQKAEAYF